MGEGGGRRRVGRLGGPRTGVRERAREEVGHRTGWAGRTAAGDAASQTALTASGRVEFTPICRDDIGRLCVPTRGPVSSWYTDDLLWAALQLEVADHGFEASSVPPAAGEEQAPRVHVFNTFLLEKLVREGYGSVGRWLRVANAGYDVLKCDFLAAPAHHGNHWTLLHVGLRARRFTHLDSQPSDAHHWPLLRLAMMLDGLVQERAASQAGVRPLLGACEPLHAESWLSANSADDHPANTPLQHDDSQCGPHTVLFARCLLRGEDPATTPPFPIRNDAEAQAVRWHTFQRLLGGADATEAGRELLAAALAVGAGLPGALL